MQLLIPLVTELFHHCCPFLHSPVPQRKLPLESILFTRSMGDTGQSVLDNMSVDCFLSFLLAPLLYLLQLLRWQLSHSTDDRFGVIGGASHQAAGCVNPEGARAGGLEVGAAESSGPGGVGDAGGAGGEQGAGWREVREVPVLDMELSQLSEVVSWRLARFGTGEKQCHFQKIKNTRPKLTFLKD